MEITPGSDENSNLTPGQSQFYLPIITLWNLKLDTVISPEDGADLIGQRWEFEYSFLFIVFFYYSPFFN